MATVYLGHDERLDVQRAIKVLSPLLAARPEIRARFETEARTMAKLQHPNIVSVQDVGTDGDRVYLVMELVETGSLIDLLDRRGAMAPKDACDAVIAILLGLQVAHARGVVHRDIKPHNVLVTPDGNYKVADFGIAHVTGGDRSATRTGMAMGTLSYMAPEQRTNAKQVDGRADLYAVSATFYALLTNKEPFELHAVDHQDEIFDGLPRVVVDIMKRASRFRAEDRYPDAATMIAALRDARAMLAPSEPRQVGASGGHPTLALGADSYVGALIPDAPGPSPTQAPRGGETFEAEAELDDRIAARPVPALSPAARAPAPRTPRDPEPSFVSDPFESKAAVEPRSSVAGRRYVAVGVIGLVGVAVLAVISAVSIVWWQSTQGAPVAAVESPVTAQSPVTAAPVPDPAAPDRLPVVAAPVSTPTASATPPVTATPPDPAQGEPVAAQPAPPAEKPKPPSPKAPASAAPAASEPAAPAVAMQMLSINSLPWSNVTVDGKGVGTTGWSGTVRAGTHRVVLKTSDGKTKSLDLNVKDTGPMRFCWDFGTESECSR